VVVAVFALTAGECPGREDNCVVSTATGVLGGELIGTKGDDRPEPVACGEAADGSGVLIVNFRGLSVGLGLGGGAGWLSISSISLRGVFSS